MNLDEENAFPFSNKFPSFDHADNGRSLNQTMDEAKEKSDRKRTNTGSIDLGQFYSWPSSRIVRVPRASAAKDRHSKVVTSKGLRDRRVRLSVNTAIQFYDLQDRLGYDQPSKAVEWLLKAAESSISELPPMPNNPFPDTPKCYDKRSSSTIGINGGSDLLVLEDLDHHPPAAGEVGDCGGNNNQQQVANKSCSSASTETSKGSGLSLSRSEIRVKARERAKERAAEKEKETAMCLNATSQPMTSSFTNSGSGGTINESNFFLKSPRHWSSSSTTATTPMDYFTSMLQMQSASNPPITSPMFSVTGDNNHNGGLQHFSFVPDHMVHSSNNNSHDQQNSTLNFTISSLASNSNTSTIAGFNRGTLQSNSASSSSSSISSQSLQLPQRFPNIDGSPQSFFYAPMDNNSSNANHYHQFLSGYDAGRLQLSYGDLNQHDNIYNARHSKEKGKN